MSRYRNRAQRPKGKCIKKYGFGFNFYQQQPLLIYMLVKKHEC